MDIQQYASNPSDPEWEEPTWSKNHVIVIQFHKHGQNSDDDSNSKSLEDNKLKTKTARAEALNEAAEKLVHLCASGAPVSEVQDFLAKWEDPSSSGRVQPNALAWFNDTDAVALASDSQDTLRTLLERGLQPTMEAVKCWKEDSRQNMKKKDIIQLLVDFGLDINHPVNDTTPPLMSLFVKDIDMVRWCLSLGADPNASSPSGDTVMRRAAIYAYSDTLKLLVEHGGLVQERDLVACACFVGSRDQAQVMEAVRFLLDHGAPIDACFVSSTVEGEMSCLDMLVGRTNGLHFAIHYGQRDLVKLLIERGADRNLSVCSVMTTKGQTMYPVEMAKMCGYEDIATLLESPDTSAHTS